MKEKIRKKRYICLAKILIKNKDSLEFSKLLLMVEVKIIKLSDEVLIYVEVIFNK